MKLTKKLLAIMLSLIMVFTMIAVPVSAVGTIAEDTAVEEVVGEETTDEEAADEETTGQFSGIFDAIRNLIEAIHNLVGNTMGALGKECPFCDKVHDKDEGETEEPDTPEVPDEPVEPDVPDTPDEPEEITYTVSFDLNYEGAENTIPSQIVKKGENVVEPDAPLRENYMFVCWYTRDEEIEQIFDFAKEIDKDIVVFAKWESVVTFNDFFADTYDILVNEEKEVVFTATVVSEDELRDSVFVTSDDGNIVCYLYDNGEGCDAVANDGVFSGKKTLSSEERKGIYYYAQYKNVSSKKHLISFYSPLTEEDRYIYNEFNDSLQDIKSKYIKTGDDAQDLELAKNAYTEIMSCIDTQINEGIVKSYDINESGICVILANNTRYYIFFENLLGERSSMMYARMSNARETIVRNTVQNKIATFDYFDEAYVDDTAEGIADKVNNYSYDLNANNDRFTVSSLKSIDDYKVIIIRSHGGNWDGTYVLQTGETVTESRTDTYTEDGDYDTRIFPSDSGEYVVSEDFFDKYYNSGDFDNTLLYLGTCHSADSSNMANTMLRKGCATVLGFENSVYHNYGNAMCESIFEKMTENNDTYNDLFTVYQGVNFAKMDHGEDDTGWFDSFLQWVGLIDDKVPAKIKIFGDSGFRFTTKYLSGVVKSIKGEDISNAWVKIQEPGKGHLTYTSVRVRDGGYFTVDVSENIYDVEISAYGYLTRNIMNVEIQPEGTTYLSETKLIPNDSNHSKVGGVVLNAITSEPVKGVTIKFLDNHGVTSGEYVKDLNGTVIEISSDDRGCYYTEKLIPGYYTAEISKDGYVTEYADIFAYTNTTTQNVSISPTMPEGQYRIVLTWGAEPRDLDSHLYATVSETQYHVYFSNKNAYKDGVNIINLDVDDTSGYGPETTTIITADSGIYRFYIHKYSGSGSIATSNAQVKLYKGNNLLGIFNSPVDQGNGIYWNVFSIKNGNIVTKNTITSSPDLSY